LHNSDNVSATIERYITGTKDLLAKKYHLVSVPLKSNTYQSGLWIDSYLFTYTEKTNSWRPWDAPTGNTLNTHEGAMVYSIEDTKTYEIKGQLNNGAYSPSVNYTGAGLGFNLVPNPYPSAIDWQANGWTKTNIGATIWGFDPQSKNYGSWNGITSTNHVTNIIPVGQAFFVAATSASPVLTMTNSVRLHSGKEFLKTTDSQPGILHLLVNSSVGDDEIAIEFASDASTTSNDRYDAVKFYSSMSIPQLSAFTTEDSLLLSINGLPITNKDLVVPLRFETNYEGEITFSTTGIESFSSGQSIKLEDRLLNRMTDLTTIPTVTVDHLATDDPYRFRLHFSGVNAVNEQKNENQGRAYLVGNELYLSYKQAHNSNAEAWVYNSLGQLIESYRLNGSGEEHHSLESAPGMYIVKLKLSTGDEAHKIVLR